MKKICVLAGFAVLTLVMAGGVFAQEDEFTPPPPSMTDEPANRLFVVFSEGAACSWLTRIIMQTERSNFVFEDFLPGAYFRVDLQVNEYIAPMARIGVFYPLISTFNRFPQEPKTPLHFGVDMMPGVMFSTPELKYFRLNGGPALHFFFLNADRWNYFDLGLAAFVGVELSLFTNWTLLCNGYASIDNGNLGGNRNMEPFDIAYQYQVDIGVRYSTAKINKNPLFSNRQKESDKSLLRR
jgi:hypothetical protein